MFTPLQAVRFGEHVFTRKALKNVILREEWCPSAVTLPAPGRTTGHGRGGVRESHFSSCPLGLLVAALPAVGSPGGQRCPFLEVRGSRHGHLSRSHRCERGRAGMGREGPGRSGRGRAGPGGAGPLWEGPGRASPAPIGCGRPAGGAARLRAGPCRPQAGPRAGAGREACASPRPPSRPPPMEGAAAGCASPPPAAARPRPAGRPPAAPSPAPRRARAPHGRAARPSSLGCGMVRAAPPARV